MTQSLGGAVYELLLPIVSYAGDPAKTERISQSFKAANRALYRSIFAEYENSNELVFYCNFAKSKYKGQKMSDEERYMALVQEVYTKVMEKGASLQNGKILIFNNTPRFYWEGKFICSLSKLNTSRLNAIAAEVAPHLNKLAINLVLVFWKIAEQSIAAKNFLNQYETVNEIASQSNESLFENAEMLSAWMENNPQFLAKRLRKIGTFTAVWKVFKKTKKISKLTLDNCNLSFLPKEISHLTSLQTLNVHDNTLESLPESLGDLTNLRNLVLSNNSLEILPESFKNLKKIEMIDLSLNAFETLPDCFERFTHLKTANFSFNDLQFLPKSLDHCKNLKYLSLKNNQLKALPMSFGKLGNLKKLDLSHNELEVLPDSFGNLGRLQSLLLSSNRLKTLPDSFKNLRSLKECRIDKNRLRFISCFFGKLKNLEILDLSHNELNALALSIRNLEKLKILYLNDNPIKDASVVTLRSSIVYIYQHQPVYV